MKQQYKLYVCLPTVILAVLGYLLVRPVEAAWHSSLETNSAVDLPEGSIPWAGPVDLGLSLIAPPTIKVWYGSHQRFGHLGTAQEWVNILGNVSDQEGIASLVYSLNDGPPVPLSIGPDHKRLVGQGDFNVDIAYADLASGTNDVAFTATSNLDETTVSTVTVEYVAGNVWPTPYSIDWSSVAAIQDAVQVVDGLWTQEADGIRTVNTGYDRLVAIGDVSWDDYEVTVPVTIHSAGSSGGVGIFMRWKGHTDDPFPGWQPKTGWLPMGGLGWYRWWNDGQSHRLELMGNHHLIAAEASGRTLKLGVRYIFKMRVETNPDHPGLGGYYAFKVWREGKPEPEGWDLAGQDSIWGLENGSLLLLAHRADASFGDVTVTPIKPAYELTLNTEGNGTVEKVPDQPAYAPGDVVTLIPTPDRNWRFGEWGGLDADDLVYDDENDTWLLTMDWDKSVTATFTQFAYDVVVTIDGNGTVDNRPGNPYMPGEVATLEPDPNLGWHFDVWSGPGADDLEDHGYGTWSLTMDEDKALTATFAQDVYTVTVETVGQGTVDHTPGNPYLYGQVATLAPDPDKGWHFDVWGGPGVDDLEDNGDGTWSLAMDGNKGLTAIFAQNVYTLTVLTIGLGTVDHGPGNPYPYGQVATLAPDPHPGWSFDGWSGPDAGDLEEIGDSTWSLSMDEDKALTAIFGEEAYTVTVETVGQGTVRATPENPHFYGHVAILEPIPDPGWRFSRWEGPDAADLIDNGDGAWSLTMDSNKAVTAIFRYQILLPFVLRLD